ncbi:MAG: hypothetical protein R3E98_16500 [Gemmatimonadota bacterium]
MGCQEFLAGFSDFHDGVLGPDERASFARHRASCCRCDRYARVVERSGRVVRDLPHLEATPEFRARLHARLSEERALNRLARSPQGSVATTGALAGVAVVLVILAWLPTLQPVVVDVTLPAIAAVPPTRPQPRLRLGSTPFPGGAGLPGVLADDFWGDANALLHEYSSVAGYRTTTPLAVRAASFQ